MHTVFILVKPSVPQNIGAAARAINTMGFSGLRLVAPQCDHLEENSWYMAHGSTHILKNARVYKRLDRALADCDFRIGTTARKRSGRKEYVSSRDLGTVIAGKAALIKKIALVFGPERHGLSNSDLAFCHCVSTIPLSKKQPSLNLAQAVMVYAYELQNLPEKQPAAGRDPLQYNVLSGKVASLLDRFDLPRASPIHKRIIERLALLETADVRLVHSVCNKVEEKSTGVKKQFTAKTR
ncbi:MAG: tRNA/rRNA methyltransferase [Chitinispirillaceae bacterium]|nr:tRNA/rRNA methyltransferase [Chitinispirillaceae bacterium]